MIAARWEEALRKDRIVCCQPVALEVLFSARRFEDFEAIDAALDALRMVPSGDSVQRAARAAMHALAQKGRHRIPPFDYVVAAAAESAGVAVLHYDADFDALAEVLEFESVWVAPRGSIP